MTVLDWTIIVVYLGGVVWLGARYARRQSDTTEYFLGGRRMPLWAVTLSVIAAEISAATFLGAPAESLSEGGNFAYILFPLGFIVGRLILALFFLGLYRKLELYTVYGFLEKRFGPPTKNAAAGVFLIARVLASGVRLFFPALAIRIIAGIDLSTSVVIVGGLGLLYTFLGGIRGVIWTEVIQAITFIAGGIGLIVLVIWQIDGGLSAAIAVCVEHNKFEFWQTGGSIWSNKYHPFTALTGAVVLALASHGTDQDMCQRMLTCKTSLASRLSVVYSGLIGVPVAVIFLSLGLALFAFVELNGPVAGAAQSSEVLPHFVANHLSMGVPGLMLAALAAATLSTHASSIAALASTTVVDFYRPYIRRDASERHYVWVSRAVSVFWGVALIGAALAAAWIHEHEKATIIDLALGAMTLVYGPLLGVFLVGIFTPFGRNASNLTGMAVGFVVVITIALKNRLLDWTGLVDAVALNQTLDATAALNAKLMAAQQPLTELSLTGWDSLYAFSLAWPWWIIIGTALTAGIALLGGRTNRPRVQ